MKRGDRIAQVNCFCSFILLEIIYIIHLFCLIIHSASKNISLPKFPFVVNPGKFRSVPFQKNSPLFGYSYFKLVLVSSMYSVCGHVEVIFFSH